jgi:hypothetical protein
MERATVYPKMSVIFQTFLVHAWFCPDRPGIVVEQFTRFQGEILLAIAEAPKSSGMV